MKKQRILFLLCALCLLVSCAKGTDQPRLFFAWTQGYLASPVGEECVLALTFYQKKSDAPFDLSKLASVQMDGISGQDISLDCDLEAIDVESRAAYQPYALRLTYTPHSMGRFATEAVTFTLNDQTRFTYPFGRLVFEIGEADSGVADTWSAPAASGVSDQFPYQYSLSHENAKLIAVKVGENTTLSDAAGLSVEGSILLNDVYAAPLVIVRSKLSIEQNGCITTAYGKGCYCGAIDGGDRIFERSLEHWTS